MIRPTEQSQENQDKAESAPFGSEASATPPDTEPTLTDDEFKDLFQFDSMALAPAPEEGDGATSSPSPAGPDGEEAAQQADTGKELEVATSTSDPAPATDQTSENTQVPEQKTGEQSRIDDLAQTVATLAEQNRQLLAQLAARGTAQPTESQPAPEEKDEVPPYLFEIPGEILTGLRSEDTAEQSQAVQHLLSGFGRTIHRSVLEVVDNKLAAVPTMFEEQSSRKLQEQAIFNDFYGTYPELNNPALYGLIKDVGTQTSQELGVSEWNRTLRDEIGKRVKSLLSGVVPGNQPQADPQPQPKPATNGALPPGQISSTGRPTTQSGDAVLRDIEDTIMG